MDLLSLCPLSPITLLWPQGSSRLVFTPGRLRTAHVPMPHLPSPLTFKTGPALLLSFTALFREEICACSRRSVSGTHRLREQGRCGFKLCWPRGDAWLLSE
ncbi:unnamed protein product [Gulo gulo]|uniref:Uncharacterized protein n=1 Tax=Gulo gulo TaxID=48420 RepID=A0A9X9M5S9_GULGU|nr:unnamed protein product [Gulo gulo]